MKSEPQSEKVRREYWQEQMEKAYEFMMRILAYPVRECGEPLVMLREVAKAHSLKVMFAEPNPSRSYTPIFCLREGLIQDFIAAATALNERGWILRIEDAYRTIQMQRQGINNNFDNLLQRLLWECGGKLPDADLMLRRITVMVATIPKIGTHMSGSAMDISVFQDGGASELDRGCFYLEMSELTPMDSPFVSEAAQRNRREITSIMKRFGFVHYPFEFWHYSKGDAYEHLMINSGQPARYGAIDWDPTTGRVKAIEDPTAWLVSREHVQAELARAIERLDIRVD